MSQETPESFNLELQNMTKIGGYATGDNRGSEEVLLYRHKQTGDLRVMAGWENFIGGGGVSYSRYDERRKNTRG
jgi:hypothetical protein